MRFFALEEHRQRDSSDGDPEWTATNIRIGGYKSMSRAINALFKKSTNGRVVDQSHRVVALIQEGKLTYPL